MELLIDTKIQLTIFINGNLEKKLVTGRHQDRLINPLLYVCMHMQGNDIYNKVVLKKTNVSAQCMQIIFIEAKS